MKFFVPMAKDENQAKSVYDAIVQNAKENLRWEIKDTKIFSVRYIHEGKEYYAEVGKKENFTGDLVMAILNSNCFLVCTVNRGGLRGEPILVGTEEVKEITLFDND